MKACVYLAFASRPEVGARRSSRKTWPAGPASGRLFSGGNIANFGRRAYCPMGSPNPLDVGFDKPTLRRTGKRRLWPRLAQATSSWSGHERWFAAYGFGPRLALRYRKDKRAPAEIHPVAIDSQLMGSLGRIADPPDWRMFRQEQRENFLIGQQLAISWPSISAASAIFKADARPPLEVKIFILNREPFRLD